MIRNIIFDWSGTLVDDLPAVWLASNFVFRKAGVPELSLEQFRSEFCLPFKLFYDRFVPHVALPELETWFHSHFREVKDSVRELPQAREFLEFCRQRGVRSLVLSTVHRHHYAAQNSLTGFGRFFEAAYVEVYDKRQKVLDLLAWHGLKADETLFVGDMQHDMETARQGGLHSCAVLTGYNGLGQLRASRPELIVANLGELREVLAANHLEWDHGQNPDS